MSTASSYTDPTQHLWWLGSRALGVVAMLLVSASVGLGLALSGRLGTKPGASARLKTLHEAVSLVSLAAIAGHGLLLLGDSYLRPGLRGVLLPFAMQSQPAWTGVGIIAGWLALILGLSFYVRRWISVAVWRWLHRWTILVYGLGIAHTLGSGTDAASAWLVAMLAIASVPVVFAGVARSLPRSQRRRPRSHPRPEPVPPAALRRSA